MKGAWWLVVGGLSGLLGACGDSSTGTSEDVGTSESALTKGSPGAKVGDPEYCNDTSHLCGLGEGDCDSNAQCQPGYACVPGNLAKRGAGNGDACAPATCGDHVRNGNETSIDCGGDCGSNCYPVCDEANGNAGKCNSDCLCGVGEGACSGSAECQAGLVCGSNNGARFGLPSGTNVCWAATCQNGVKDGNETAVDCGGSCAPCAPPAAGTVNIASNGAALLPIVIAPHADPALHAQIVDIANELRDKLNAIVGATATPFYVAAATSTPSGISLGIDGDFPNVGWPYQGHFHADDLLRGGVALPARLALREQYVLRTPSGSNRVIVAGATVDGLRDAVWDLLGRVGYRHYFQTTKWEVIPSSPSLSLNLAEEERPPFFARSFIFNRNSLAWDTASTTAINAEQADWSKHNRAGGMVDLDPSSASNYKMIMAWWAQRHGGTFPGALTTNPGASNNSRQFCLTSSAVVGGQTFTALDVVREWAAAQTSLVVAISPTPGITWTASGSPTCNDSTDPTYSNVANRVAALANAAAALLPTKVITARATEGYPQPPTLALRQNVFIVLGSSYAPNQSFALDDRIENWSGATKQLGVGDYFTARGTEIPGSAMLSIDDVVGRATHFYELGARQYSVDINWGWGLPGPSVWALSQTLWDADSTVDTTSRANAYRDDFIARAFGDAAPAARKYYGVLEKHPIWSENLLGVMYRALSEGFAATSSPTPENAKIQLRLGDLAIYTRYLELYRRFWNRCSAQAPTTERDELKALLSWLYATRDAQMTHSRDNAAEILLDLPACSASQPTGTACAVPEWGVNCPSATPTTECGSCSGTTPPGGTSCNPTKNGAYPTLTELQTIVAAGVANNAVLDTSLLRDFSRDLVPYTPPAPALSARLPTLFTVLPTSLYLQRPTAQGPISLHVKKYATAFSFLGQLTASNGTVVGTQSLGGGALETDWPFITSSSSTYRFDLDDQGSAAYTTLPSGTRVAIPVGKDDPRLTLNGKWSAYFLVPAGTTHVVGWSESDGQYFRNRQTAPGTWTTDSGYFSDRAVGHACTNPRITISTTLGKTLDDHFVIPVSPPATTDELWLFDDGSTGTLGARTLLSVPPYLYRSPSEVLVPREVAPETTNPQPCNATTACPSGMYCSRGGTCRSDGTVCAATNDCAGSNICSNGQCKPGGPGTVCGSDSDCDSGLACGTNNGGFFGLARSARVCWAAGPCGDGVDASECGTPTSTCGTNCGGVKPCDPAVVGACPSGEACVERLSQPFNVDIPWICLPTQCPSDDPALCGSADSLCGPQCVCTPDCSNATAAGPDDGCGGICPHLCPTGQSCCASDIECATGSSCQLQADGLGKCLPADCAFRALAPPLCGSPGAICGEQCPVCTPDCSGRQCGLDPQCGTTCGTCAADSFCDGNGQCQAKTIEQEPIQVPDGNGGQIEVHALPPPPTSAAGSLAGHFSVTDEGTAEFNIPIEVPPGRAGIEPVISLHYAETRQNGQVGVGWSLAGLSQVARCPKVYALDGYAAPVKNDHTDPFCIDGKRLEPVPGSATYGADGAEYRTLVDTFTKVVSKGGGGGTVSPWGLPTITVPPSDEGPEYFEAWTKDGRKLTYGRSPDSVVMRRDQSRTVWLLSRVEDRAGNYMTINYLKETLAIPLGLALNVPTAVKPSSIFYTGHGSTSGTREVRFEYEDRSDGQLNFQQGGTPTVLAQRLKRITTLVRGQPVRNYELAYKSGSTSQLEKVYECPKDITDKTKCKPPTEFAYESQSGFTQGPDGHSLAGAGKLDLDGDGIGDYLITTVSSDGVPANPTMEAVAIGVDVWQASSAVYLDYYAQGAGTAASLMWALTKRDFWGLFADTPEIHFQNSIEKGTGLRSAPLQHMQASGMPCDGYRSFFVDYDQDGKDDILGLCAQGAVRVAGSHGDGTFAGIAGADPALTLPLNLVPDHGGFRPAQVARPAVYDVDGDGLQDIAYCEMATSQHGAGGVLSYANLKARLRVSPDGGFADAIELAGYGGRVPYCGDAVPTHQIFDIDGDGTPELLTYFSPNGNDAHVAGGQAPYAAGWYALRFSRSSSGQSTIAWSPVDLPNVGNSAKGEGLLLGDMNGDGLNDIWGADRSSPEAIIWLNTGDGRFIPMTLARPRPSYDADNHFRVRRSAIIDYDSNGRLDVLEQWEKQFDGNWSSPPVRRDYALLPNSMVTSLTAQHAADLFYQDSPGFAQEGGFTSVGDIDNDGSPDLFGEIDHIFFGSGTHNMLLKSVTDGLGNVLRVDYDGPDSYVGECPEQKKWPERCLKQLKGLVSHRSQGFLDGTGAEHIEHNYYYKYRNARVSVTGHGWLGFDSTSVTENANDFGKTVTTEFEPPQRYTPAGTTTQSTTPPYLYPLAGLARTVTVDQVKNDGGASASPLEDGPKSRRTRVSNFWSVHVSADQRPYPMLSGATTETFSRPVPQVGGPPVADDSDGDLRTRCVQSNPEVDLYGNVKQHFESCQRSDIQHCVELACTATEMEELQVFKEYDLPTKYSSNREGWIIANTNDVLVRSCRQGGSQTLCQPRHYTYGYDARGQLNEKTRDPEGEAEYAAYFRKDDGNIWKIVESEATGEDPRTTTIAYEAESIYPFSVTQDVDATHELTSRVIYDPRFGVPIVTIDPNGVFTARAYDDFGNLALTRGPSGETTYDYSNLSGDAVQTAAGTIYPRLRIHSEDHSIGGVTFGGAGTVELDSYGRVVRSTMLGLDGAEVISEQAYDAAGHRTGATGPHLASASDIPAAAYEYDYLDRVTRVENSDQTFSEHQYASRVSLAAAYQPWVNNINCGPRTTDNLCAVDVELSIGNHSPGEPGKQNAVVRDHRGGVVRSIDGENIATAAHYSSYEYGPFNHLRQMRDNANVVTVFDHDDYGRLKTHVDPDNGATQYTYDGFGELKRLDDAKGEDHHFTYDRLGRRLTTQDSSGTTYNTYDQGVAGLGHLYQTVTPSQQYVIYNYEAPTPEHNRGLVSSMTHVIDGANYTTYFKYDDLARLDVIEYPSTGSGVPVKAKYGYDAASGAMTNVSEIGSGTSRPIWHLDSTFQGYRVAQETFGNGAVSTTGYEPDLHRLKSIKTVLDGQTVQDLEYTYYDNGQVHERITPNETREYLYDALGRLSMVDSGQANPPQYHYDLSGNITQHGATTNVYRTGQPHLLDHIGGTQYGYDGNGNVTSRIGPEAPEGAQSIYYTPFDLPRRIDTGIGVSLRTTELDYSGEGERVVRRDLVGTTVTSTRHFASGLYQRLLDNLGNTLEERFRIPGGSGIVAEIGRTPDGENILYFHPDNLGTTETITDGAGVVTHQDFDAFGSLQGAVPGLNEDLTRTGYTGHQQDNDLGLIDMGGRIYEPLAARFMQADPIMQAPFWSQGHNRYSYVFNDPINTTDPSGFAADGEDVDNFNQMTGGPVIHMGGIALMAVAGTISPGQAGTIFMSTLNILDTATHNPFAGSSGFFSQPVAGASAAPTGGSRPSGASAVGQMYAPGPSVQERAANIKRNLDRYRGQRLAQVEEDDEIEDEEWDEIINGPRLEEEPHLTEAEEQELDEMLPFRMRPVPRTAVRRAPTPGDTHFPTANDALREGLRRHGIDPTTIEVQLMYGQNPNLTGPKGEPYQVIRGLNPNGDLIEFEHHANGHYFEDTDEFELQHYHGPNGEHLTY